MIVNNFHLSYCTNIHAGETWEETFENLKIHTLKIAGRAASGKPFGIGLRLSSLASEELLKEDNLWTFRHWLINNNLYIFTINGFPYGNFHRKKVKDLVHKPDWTTKERREYTLRLARILAHLLPEEMEGSISTSPVSYKHWFVPSEQKLALKQGAENMALVALELDEIYRTCGKKIHVDIEPEPDGLLENTNDLLNFFLHYLYKYGIREIIKDGISCGKAEQILKEHIGVCYDICHFALAYEEPLYSFDKFKKAGIKIGKVQISSALKLMLPALNKRKALISSLNEFADPVYLHQVVNRNEKGRIIKYPDFSVAMEDLMDPNAEEWRIHFHVPIFTEDYGIFSSTQHAINDTLSLLKRKNICTHLEIETYTWEVLPESLKGEINELIIRELEWVVNKVIVKNSKKYA